MSEIPHFDDGLALFLRFLEEQGNSTELVWIFQEDVRTDSREYWVRYPASAGNLSLARQYYEYCHRRGLGVTLGVLCHLQGCSACYVWVADADVPEDWWDAESSVRGPLKLTIPVRPAEAIAVGGRWAWAVRRWRCWWNEWNHFNKMLPSRREVRALLRRSIDRPRHPANSVLQVPPEPAFREAGQCEGRSDYFYFEAQGKGPGVGVVHWRDGVLVFGKRDSITEVYPTRSEWLNFWAVVDDLPLGEWSAGYGEDVGVIDGFVWYLEMRRLGNEVSCSGKDCRDLAPPGFERFLDALMRLIRYRESPT